MLTKASLTNLPCSVPYKEGIMTTEEIQDIQETVEEHGLEYRGIQLDENGEEVWVCVNHPKTKSTMMLDIPKIKLGAYIKREIKTHESNWVKHGGTL